MCFVLEDINGPFPVAKFWAPILSSQAVATFDTPFKSKCICALSSITSRRVKTNSLIPWERAIYSDSSVDRAISDCNLELQKIGTLPKLSSIPVLLLTLMGSMQSSELNKLAKSASAYMSNYRLFLSGVISSPLSLVPCKYLAMCFSPTS